MAFQWLYFTMVTTLSVNQYWPDKVQSVFQGFSVENATNESSETETGSLKLEAEKPKPQVERSQKEP